MVKKYKYERICALDDCNKKFKTNYKQKIFHEPACHDEYHRRMRTIKSGYEKELSALKKRIDALETDESKKV
ncbi:MAG: hypothetical protein KAT69_03160 [Candidatus Aminicenantes bacterium]|nr:hypothetical protein [Candidatus Aminicenantes bacterium]